ncbi:MAG: pepT [Peptococcaceae bacterium]|nr:pepT [Peptococcaceae bacterium]
MRELKELGLEDAEVDEKGYVLATLPGNTADPAPAIGFIAHMDTSPDCSAEKVRPHIIRNYPGGDILLNKERHIVLAVKDFPELEKYRGQDLITTDGTTLLGADDKAGIAEIITAVSYLLKHPEIKHGPIRIGFTPDEEIGRGTNHFDVAKFGAHFAYTIDGGELGELETENFNAASATFTVHGKSVHPGSAKNKMINSLLIAREIISYFPENETPAATEGYEGFYHLHQMNGSVEKTVLRYLIRDHDKNL